MKNGEGDEQFRVIGANGLCGSDACTRAVLMLDEGSVVRWVLFRERLGSDGLGFVSMMVLEFGVEQAGMSSTILGRLALPGPTKTM
ncbi:hypothetical protein V6N12_062326 [Hibiscus sabdariffa]|uniref:Uncharacterized protein n=1 Tax=Hibiscus sabdariffa TaxID=183260 RepID=A0ABR2F8H9_9ROSI